MHFCSILQCVFPRGRPGSARFLRFGFPLCLDLRNESTTVHSRTQSSWPEEWKTPRPMNCLQQVSRDVPKIGKAAVAQAVATLTEL